jgi:hypothetical protein
MKRLLGLLAFTALVLPASVGAKGFISLSVCGTNGCHTTRDKQVLAAAMDGEPQADPGQTGPFFKLRTAIGEPGHKGALAHVESWWMPSVGVIRGDEGPLAGYTLPSPATAVTLRRLSRDLHPFPAAQLPTPPGQPQDARVDEVVPAPASGSSGSGGGHGGGGSGWAWSLLAIAPAGLAFWLRRRRRGRPELA